MSNDIKQFSDKRLKIELRLAKREKGWLDIDDAALHRLKTEAEFLLDKETE